MWLWQLDWTIVDCTSWQLDNVDPRIGTSGMVLVANTKGAAWLTFAEDEDTPLFLPGDATSWRIYKGNSGNRDPRGGRWEAVD